MSFDRIRSRRLSVTGEEEGAACSATRGGEPLLLSPATLRVEDLRAVFSVLVVLGNSSRRTRR
jgi:hypothetical protein